MLHRLVLSLFWLLIVGYLKGQAIRQTIVQPSVNLSHKISSEWKLNMKIESRQLADVSDLEDEQFSGYQYVHTDIAMVASYKSGFNHSIAGGYMIRIRRENNAHRTIQQYAIIDKKEGIRWGYRLASDQTWSSGDDMELRLRGRVAAEIPLSGLEIDTHEWYMKIQHEYLNSWEGNNYDLEIRLAPTIGYEISGSNQIEASLEYRVNGFFEDRYRHRYFIGLGWYLRI